MKKILSMLFVVFVCNVLFFSEEPIKVYLDMKNTEVFDLLGEPSNVTVEEFEANHDWDMICYEYKDRNISIYMYRIVNCINGINSNSNDIVIQIDNSIIKCGQKKEEIESVFGKGIFNKYLQYRDINVYHYGLYDFRDLYCLYNTEDILVGIIYGYENPD